MTDLSPTARSANPHERWLRELSVQLHAQKRTAAANTCERAADEIAALVRRLYPGGNDEIARLHCALIGCLQHLLKLTPGAQPEPVQSALRLLEETLGPDTVNRLRQ